MLNYHKMGSEGCRCLSYSSGHQGYFLWLFNSCDAFMGSSDFGLPQNLVLRGRHRLDSLICPLLVIYLAVRMVLIHYQVSEILDYHRFGD